MKPHTILKIVAVVLGIIAIVLIGVLLFVNPAKSPTVPFEVDLPHANDRIVSPVAIEGSVTGGGWFFEASFPIKIVDANGNVLGQGTAQALSDWTSTGTVPFSASISFTAPSTTNGKILFMNDDPSAIPQNAKSLSVPVQF
jgi:hypothetical protein